MSAITPRKGPGARARAHIRSNVVAYVALFFALSGGAAWATHPGGENTISSVDIIDEEVRSEDIRNANVQNPDIQTEAVSSGKVEDQTLTKADLAAKSVGSFELDGNAFRTEDIRAQFQGFGKAYGIPADAIQSDEISDGTVQPADLAEQAKGPLGFEFADDDTGIICNDGCVEGSLTLPPGFYLVFAKIEVTQDDVLEDLLSVRCDLTNGGSAFDHAFARVLGEVVGGAVRPTRATLALQGQRLLIGRGVVSISCADFDVGDAEGLNLKLNAIKLGAFG